MATQLPSNSPPQMDKQQTKTKYDPLIAWWLQNPAFDTVANYALEYAITQVVILEERISNLTSRSVPGTDYRTPPVFPSSVPGTDYRTPKIQSYMFEARAQAMKRIEREKTNE